MEWTIKEPLSMQFAGMTRVGEHDNEDEWETVYDDEGKILQTVKTFEYREEGFNFDYKYMISTNVIHDLDSKYLVRLDMVISPDSLGDKMRDSIKDGTGGYCEYQDLLSHGGASINIDNVIISYNEESTYIKLIENICDGVDSFFGFHMDKQVNRLGSTGWDIIKYAIGLQDRWY